MDLHYWKSAEGNFGDDLNRWLWPRLVPEIVDWGDREGWMWVGIGSILNESLPADRPKIIFGTGAGYFDVPPTPDRTWHVYALRGPLTARVLGLPLELAVTDSAALLVDVDAPRVQEDAERASSVFVPHHSTAKRCGPPWRRICRQIGVEYLDPREPVEKVLGSIGSAELVVAEAMHAAIAADALRCPWIPVRTRDAILPFKWKDWCRSLDLEYSPAWLPPLWDHTGEERSLKAVYWKAKEAVGRTKLRWLIRHGRTCLSDRDVCERKLGMLRERLDRVRSDLNRGTIRGWQLN